MRVDLGPLANNSFILQNVATQNSSVRKPHHFCKETLTHANAPTGLVGDFYQNLLAKEMKSAMARLARLPVAPQPAGCVVALEVSG
jgi:hypothetical protein